MSTPPPHPEAPLPSAAPPADPAALRVAYADGRLDEGAVAGDWLGQFDRWFTTAVAGGLLAEPNACVLATASPAGVPSARTVLLKAVDARGFVVYTNYTSRKGFEALQNPRAALCFSWVPLQRQVQVEGRVERVSRAETLAYATTRPHGSQLGAWISPQSRVIAGRAELAARAAAVAARFGDGPVPVPPDWGGLRIVPEAVEFWQGRPDRLHDRLRFRDTHTAAGWVLERLAP
ncbi:MAG: putative pyridoxamine 5-phosphate oxidase-related protein [Mycobacterium sp.]|nr:putative pyridoxamine 5-phosphate oxidase-related protein [Mycobacterium sp.]